MTARDDRFGTTGGPWRVFNDLDAFDYPAGFAHSPTVGVEPCFAVELCQAPARADFTVPQDVPAGQQLTDRA